MKHIWNMDAKEVYKEGLAVGSIVTGVCIMAGLATSDILALFGALAGLGVLNISISGLIAVKLAEISEELEGESQ